MAENLILKGLEQQAMMHAQDARDVAREAEAIRYSQSEKIIEAEKKAAVAKNAIQREQEQLALAREQKQLQLIEETLGTLDAFVTGADKLNQAAMELTADAEELRRLDNVSIGKDGFWAWLGAQFKLDAADTEFKRSATIYNAMSDRLHTVSGLTDEAKRIAANSTKTITEGMIEKGDEIRLAEAEIAATKSRIMNAGTRAKAYADLFQMTRQEIDSVLSLQQEQRMQQAQTSALAEIQNEKLTFASMAEVINRYRTDLSKTPFTEQNIRDMKKAGGAAWEEVIDQYLKGIDTRDLPLAVGNDFADSFTKSIEAGDKSLSFPTPLNKAYGQVRQIAIKQVAEAGQNFNELPVEAQNQAINSTATEYFKASLDTIEPDGFNPYRVLPFEELSKNKAVTDTKLYKQYLSKADLSSDRYEQKLFEIGVAALSSGKMTVKEVASDITTFFKTAAAANNEYNNYVSRHLEPQFAYNYMLHPGGDLIGSLFQSLVKTNLMSVEEVTAALTRSFTARKRAEAASPFIFTE